MLVRNLLSILLPKSCPFHGISLGAVLSIIVADVAPGRKLKVRKSPKCIDIAL